MNNLKKLRKQAGLTQAGLARSAGMSLSQIQRYESGEHDIANMSLQNAIAIANVLETTPEKLMEK